VPEDQGMIRTDLPSAWDERSTLTAMLDYTRATVRAKCEGLSDDLARQVPLPTSPLRQLLDEYDAQSERYRALVAEHDLDSRSQRSMSTGETVTLRFVLLHLIEETARHNGHIDLLREMADGVTGS
jgi:hypothetical protein